MRSRTSRTRERRPECSSWPRWQSRCGRPRATSARSCARRTRSTRWRRAAPNVKQPGFRWISPGSLLAVFGWVVGSAAFTFYVSNFGAYNKTYGALGGVIVFLIWLWLSNLMVLLGAELNAVLERGRKLEPRDAPG